MKNYFLLIAFCFFVACKEQKTSSETTSETTSETASETTSETAEPAIAQDKASLGQALFEGKGNCIACHQVADKIIGPSIQEIAKVYKTKNGNLVDFLKYDAKPIVDPSQYEVMKTYLSITKAMTDEELKAIETYFYSSKAVQ